MREVLLNVQGRPINDVFLRTPFLKVKCYCRLSNWNVSVLI